LSSDLNGGARTEALLTIAAETVVKPSMLISWMRTGRLCSITSHCPPAKLSIAIPLAMTSSVARSITRATCFQRDGGARADAEDEAAAAPVPLA